MGNVVACILVSSILQKQKNKNVAYSKKNIIRGSAENFYLRRLDKYK